MESTTVKSLWHLRLEAARRKGGTYTPDPFSTLNEYFGIQNGEVLAAGQFPEVAYLTIGRGGHRNVSGAGGASLTDSLMHRITDARLFEHLPFVLREVDNDLTGEQRKRYRLRRLEVHGGKNYFAYYAKALAVGTDEPVTEKLVATAAGVVTTPYVFSAQQQNPVPVSMTNGEVNYASGEHLAVRNKLKEELTAADMNEILAACEIVYKDKRFAQITELAMCSGCDVTVNTTDGGKNVTYTEIRAAQCCSFAGCDYTLMYQNENITLNFSVGNTLPYLV